MIVDIKKNTDQLNFEDFLGGVTRVVTIAKVEKGRKEGQYDISIEGDDRYWRPPPTVLKQLVSAWTDEADTWVGKQALLYGDPEVMMAGQKVGGIRVSHVSHINEPVTESLSVTRGKRRPHTLHPLPDQPAAPAEDPRIVALQDKWRATQDPAERAEIEAEVSDILCRWCATAATAEHSPCCSSHGDPHCCAHYRRNHFCEVRPCCSTDVEALEQPMGAES